MMKGIVFIVKSPHHDSYFMNSVEGLKDDDAYSAESD